jgi:putative flippase GtrA
VTVERAQFLRFSLVGVAGFAVDALVLHLAMAQGEANPYIGRLISYLFAATVTWTLNRRYTFTDRRGENRLLEWSRFLGSNAVGGLLNYLLFAALVAATSTVSRFPVIGVAAGSLVGLIVNFSLTRRFVFTAHGPKRLVPIDKTILLMAMLSSAVALTQIVNPWPRDRWYLTQYVLFGSFPGYDNYTPVSVPAWVYFGAHAIATRMGLDLAGEFYIAALMQDLMLFLSACFLYQAMKIIQVPFSEAFAVGFLVVLLLIGLPHTFYSETAAVFLMCAFVLVLAAILQRQAEAGRRFWALAILGGVVLGLLIATRMTPVLLIALIPLLFWRRMPVRRIARVVGVMVFATSAVLAGMVVSNHARFGRYELSNSSGRHLWQGVKDFTDTALDQSSEYQALRRRHSPVQGAYWDKLPPYRNINESGLADPREMLLGRLAREAILSAPDLYLLHGARKFVRTIGVAPSADVYAGPGNAWNPLARTEPLPPLLDVMGAPPAISIASGTALRSAYAAFSRMYPLSIFFVSLSGLAIVAEHLGRWLRARSNSTRGIGRWAALGVLLFAGMPLACIPLAVYGRTWPGYIESGLCALALGFAAIMIAEAMHESPRSGAAREDQSWFFFSAFAFFGTLWFTWQVEYQAPRYAIPYLPFGALMLGTTVVFWKRLWHARSAHRRQERQVKGGTWALRLNARP